MGTANELLFLRLCRRGGAREVVYTAGFGVYGIQTNRKSGIVSLQRGMYVLVVIDGC